MSLDVEKRNKNINSKLIPMTYKTIKHIGITFSVIIAFIIFASPIVKGFSVDRYAINSKLANGKWARIEVTETGMQLITTSQLRQMGFNNPEKVNVYGFGGRIISEVLNEEQPDDLPQLPVIHTDRGILFFGFNTIRWSKSTSNGTNSMAYSHEVNPYSNHSYYFLSDVDTDEITLPSASLTERSDSVLTWFTERILHEQDLIAPSNTGREMLGEDFRSRTTQTFPFTLTDNANDSAYINVSFATKTTNGSSSLVFTANGKRLNATTSDNIAAITSSESFMRLISTRKKIEDATESLSLGITFSSSGTLQLANLNYIEVEYGRKLSLHNGELYFYNSFYPKSTTSNITYDIDNCSSTTQIWDITKPESPQNVAFTLNGNIASFTPTEIGYREYIAFEPNMITRGVQLGDNISNQNIHGMSVPDMLIISPEEYTSQADRIAELHREIDGMTVHVLTPEVIYNEFSSGVEDVSAFRKCLKMWYDRSNDENGKLGHCLIISRPTYDNRMITTAVKSAGYPRVPIWQSATGTSSTTSYSTDAFIGMLEDCGTTFSIESAKMSIGVGRLPVKSLTEATEATDKLISYIKEPILGAWRNNVMIIADDQDNNVHFDQAQSVYELMRQNGNGNNMLYERLYFDAYPMVKSGTGNTYPAVHDRLSQAFNEGVMYIDYIGHASPRGWSHERVWTWEDISSMNNRKLPFIYAATCEFARWDDDDVSGAEIMWLNPNAGVIGFITASRTVYIANNGDLNKSMASKVFIRDNDGKGKRIGDIFRESLNGISRSDDNKLRYILIGDPAMRLPNPSLTVTVDSIGDTDLTDSNANIPEIPARGKVKIKGHILNSEGSIANDFNGIIEPTLLDAERVIETYGNGTEGKSTMYNDRKSKLYSGKARVTNGEWEALILMPVEIDNNYSPALLSLYAYSDEGIEANGATERLYVYGYDSDAPEDVDGPEISLFALNNSNFTDGDLVSESSVAIAKLRDPSGINISGAGIGHQLSLTLDGETVYDDVSEYFSVDADDPYSGDLTYLLTDLEAGDHTLTLKAWDNANNSSEATLNFKVGANRAPVLYEVKTDANPASTNVNFLISHDRPSQTLECKIEVFDLNGRTVWSKEASSVSDYGDYASINWDLCDSAGRRVPRGIYLYRATVATQEGMETTKTNKLAITAQ